MKILVTGGAGFIGRHLVKALCDAKHDVVVLDNLSSETSSKKLPGAKLIVGDVQDAEDISRSMKGCSAVFHLAALSSVSAPDDLVYRVNFIGSKNVFEEAARVKAKVIFASSAAVYGSIPVPHKESAACKPVSMYGKTKLKAESLLPPAAFVARIFNVYGPGGHGVVNIFCDRIPKYEEIFIHGSGRQTRDFVHVDDVVRVLMHGLEAAGTVNVGTSKETGIMEIAEAIFTLTKNRPDIKFALAPKADIQRSCADVSLLKKSGYAPRISMADGLKLLLADKLAK